LAKTLANALLNALRPGLTQNASRARFGNPAYRANCERSTEDFEVVVVDLVAEAGVPDLIHPFELVEANGKAVGHDEPMEGDGESLL